MSILHVLRSVPDEQIRELMRAVSPAEVATFALYHGTIDYDELITKIFGHDRVICWW